MESPSTNVLPTFTVGTNVGSPRFSWATADSVVSVSVNRISNVRFMSRCEDGQEFVNDLFCLNNQIVRDAPEGFMIKDIEDGGVLVLFLNLVG